MVKPVVIFVDGQELVGWTSMSLSRSKDEMTGTLNVEIFFSYLPDRPVIVNAARGREILVYIGGHLAFTGVVDSRGGTDAPRRDSRGRFVKGGNVPDGGSVSSSISAHEYTVRLSARGKTKYLIDSSHQHPTTNMVKPTTREAFAKLVEPWGVQIDWLASEIKLDKLRLRDGNHVVDELQRLAREHCYYIYETRDGRLRVTDDIGPTTGEPIILGKNILQFSTEQSETLVKSRIKVKGQRIEKEVWGEDAVLKSVVEIEDQWVDAEIPYIVQHYGNGDPDSLERRARFEANKRSAQAKRVTLEVFHVQQEGGQPWDIGQLHYIEIPPEGIFDVMECVELTYHAEANNTLKTSLTFSPPPTRPASGSGGPTSNLPEISADMTSMGAARRAAAGISFAPGQFPAPWSGPVISVLQFTPLAGMVQAVGGLLSSLEGQDSTPPLQLPATYRSKDEEGQ